MLRKKRGLAALSAMALALSLCFALAGCGEPVAATYKGGKVLESEVTTEAQNMLSSYQQMYATYGLSFDSSMWSSFISNRMYDPTAMTDTSTEDSAGDGTVEEYREYLIKQIVTQKLVEQAIEDNKIEVSDADVESYVDTYRQAIESQYMKGTFESVLERQGTSLEEFTKNSKETIELAELKREVIMGEIPIPGSSLSSTASAETSTTSESAASNEAGTDETATDDSGETSDTPTVDVTTMSALEIAEAETTGQVVYTTEQEQIWTDYKDALLANADLKIKDAPKNLPYDPAVLAASLGSSTSSESTSSTDASAESADSTDVSAESSTDASADSSAETSSETTSEDASSAETQAQPQEGGTTTSSLNGSTK